MKPGKTVRILVADDFAPWRTLVRSLLEQDPTWKVIAEACDGVEAIEKASELQPDIVILDLGMPNLNGLEAAKIIGRKSPNSRTIFATQVGDTEVRNAAFRIGAVGYVLKTDALRELVPAVEGALRAEKQVPPKRTEGCGCHHAEFYPDNASLVDGFARFIETALENGSAVIFIATESHRTSVLERLKSHAVDVDAIMKLGSYTSLDVIEALRTVMGSNGLPDPARCTKVLGDLIVDSGRTGHHRVAACGEFAPFLLGKGKVEAAIQMEHLTDEFAVNHDIDIFCGYLSDAIPRNESAPIFERIRLEHSAVRGR
jgi:CheY-like chemotaxis protein